MFLGKGGQGDPTRIPRSARESQDRVLSAIAVYDNPVDSPFPPMFRQCNRRLFYEDIADLHVGNAFEHLDSDVLLKEMCRTLGDYGVLFSASNCKRSAKIGRAHV